MPFNEEETKLYRRDVKTKGAVLSVEEREALIKKYLPSPEELQRQLQPRSDRFRTRLSVEEEAKKEEAEARSQLKGHWRGTQSQSQSRSSISQHRRRIRPFLKQKFFLLVYIAIQFIFGIYIRLRQILSSLIQKFISIRHYHHRTPAYIQKDVQGLSRVPQHLSVLLKFDPSDDGSLETLLDEVAELAAWSTASGIPLLSIYEKTGVLKQYMSALHELVYQKLILYFGSAPVTPSLRVFAPNLPSLSSAVMPNSQSHLQSRPHLRNQANGSDTNGNSNGHMGVSEVQNLKTPPNLDLLLLSRSDGRDTLVDLTRTLTEMSQAKKLRPRDVTSNLIDAEINATTAIPPPPSTSTAKDARTTNKTVQESDGVVKKEQRETVPPAEPDLLIVFAPYVKLDGYPPWQIRLTEIFCVRDSGGDVSGRGRTRVEYQGFLRALWKYAGAEMRFGS